MAEQGEPTNGEPVVTYLDHVGQILYDTPESMTGADHLAVVQRGIDPSLGKHHRRSVTDYAREHIQDPEMLNSALLMIGNATIDGIRKKWAISEQPGAAEDNRERFHESKSMAEEVLPSLPDAGQEIVSDSFRLILKLEGALQPLLDDRRRTLHSGIFRTESQETPEEEDQARQELTAMAAGCLDELRFRFPDAIPEFNQEVHQLYIDQIKFAPHGRVTDELIREIIELVDETKYNAVTDLLSLTSSTDEGEVKKAILDRAITVTAASDRERPIEYKKETVKKKIGRNQVVETPVEFPSAFEKRLKLLEDRIFYQNDLKNMLDLYPDYIKRVIELHSLERQEEVWQQYARRIAGLAFTNGSYKIDEISQIMGTVQKFGEVAPSEIAEQARLQVKQKLAHSRPTIKNY